jgi:hypothetical protein
MREMENMTHAIAHIIFNINITFCAKWKQEMTITERKEEAKGNYGNRMSLSEIKFT